MRDLKSRRRQKRGATAHEGASGRSMTPSGGKLVEIESADEEDEEYYLANRGAANAANLAQAKQVFADKTETKKALKRLDQQIRNVINIIYEAKETPPLLTTHQVKLYDSNIGNGGNSTGLPQTTRANGSGAESWNQSSDSNPFFYGIVSPHKWDISQTLNRHGTLHPGGTSAGFSAGMPATTSNTRAPALKSLSKLGPGFSRLLQSVRQDPSHSFDDSAVLTDPSSDERVTSNEALVPQPLTTKHSRGRSVGMEPLEIGRPSRTSHSAKKRQNRKISVPESESVVERAG
mmetsp:Transcript_59556/g.67749  ORF Transcript_59556/g.67749 Transcript_59556/m.67749 type:complete len:290 (-) Transcript_59556:9-878(-)